MSISEISDASALPDLSRARMSAMAARAFIVGAVRIVTSSSSVRPLMMGTSGDTARVSSPSTWPSSSSQCSRPACTSVKGRRSSTRMVSRLGSARTTSARRISGIASRRPRTWLVSTDHRLAPGAMPATARMRSTDRREAPWTSTAATAKRGEVVTHAWAATTPAMASNPSSMTPPTRASRASRRARRRWAALTRCRATRGERSPRSWAAARALGEMSPTLLTEDPDLRLQRDAELCLHALACHLHEGHDVGGGGAAAVDDEVGVLGRDLGAVETLALEAHLLHEPGGDLVARVLPHAPGRRERERLRGLLVLEPLLDVFLDLIERSAVQLQPAADEHGSGRCMKRAVRDGARRRLELADGAVGVQVVDAAHEVADPAVGRAGVHGEGAADGGRDPHQAFEAAEVQRRRFADERRQAHAGARDRLFSVELGAAQAAFDLEHDAADAPVLHEQVVAAADHVHRQLIAVGKG